jgi:CRISPR-associated protein Cmx8
MLLQIQAMEILREQAQSNDFKARFIVPKHSLTKEGRALCVHFTKASFNSLMRERYRGVWALREYSKKMKLGSSREFIEETKLSESKTRYKYRELRPHFEYFEAFSAPEAWQEHIRDVTWKSYFCIPTTQTASFKLNAESGEINSDVADLWKGLVRRTCVGVKKTFCLNTWTEGLKGEDITDEPEKVLLLHFWALGSKIFTPTSLKIDKNRQGLLDCETEYHKPVIVVPDVTHVAKFANEFRHYLEKREHLAANKRHHPDLFISTPREAALSFFFTPQLAGARVITESMKGARGAEVYTFKSAGQQANIISVFNEMLDDYTRDLISEYGLILREIKSYPYRALQIENLLAGRKWHDGFDRMADKFPNELFVPKDASTDSTNRLKDQANRMAQSIRADFRIHKEEQMTGEKPNLEQIIYGITNNYVHWRARAKTKPLAPDFKFDFDDLNKLRQKKRNDQSLTADEQNWLRGTQAYVDTLQDTAEELFIRFRGRRDRKSFANLFTETFFRAFYGITAKNMKALGGFVEGNDWESAKRLVLMSISAAAAIHTPSPNNDQGVVDDFAEGDKENQEEEDR